MLAPGRVTAGNTGLVKKGTAALWTLLLLSAVLSSDAYKFEDLEEWSQNSKLYGVFWRARV